MINIRDTVQLRCYNKSNELQKVNDGLESCLKLMTTCKYRSKIGGFYTIMAEDTALITRIWNQVWESVPATNHCNCVELEANKS